MQQGMTRKGPSPQVPLEARLAFGKALRDKVPRDGHAAWSPPARRADPVAVLVESSRGRIERLLPIRYGRMLASPFAFYRGAAALMAADLARTPRTGIRVQVCGDCHLVNFGGYGTPERRLVFGINDFDETLPGPWEWDVKRLCASLVIAGRHNRLRASASRDAAVACARSYRERIKSYAGMQSLEVWYASIDGSTASGWFDATAAGRRIKRRLQKAMRQGLSEHDLPKLATSEDGTPRIRDDAPLIYHPSLADHPDFERNAQQTFDAYCASLPADRHTLLDRYRLLDMAQKVVGVGSVGTWCGIMLLMAGKTDPLFLQIKEARASVLERHLGASAYSNCGQRVVMGQRLMQSASDAFLGWTVGAARRHFYVRQLRDMKVQPRVELFDAETLALYGALCGWALALAHARSGDAALVTGYLGNGKVFDQAMGAFGEAYADQNERDYEALRKAVAAGRIEARVEE